jgi:transposase InsO family protein
MTMDLVVKLPSTILSPFYDSILVVVDRFSKYTRLVPCRESMSAAAIADLLHRHCICDFSVPDQIVSDRGSHFNNLFLSSSFSILSIRLSLSTAYHPQTDGQTPQEPYLRN